MKIGGYIHGITTHSDATLREELDIKYGRKPRREKREVLAADTNDLISLQVELGFERISDGQMLWPDLFRPVYTLLDGIKIGAQTRWFNTNGFTFTPQVIGTINSRSPDLSEFLYTEKIPADKVRKITLPGPLTLAWETAPSKRYGFLELINIYARHLTEVARDLARRGYEYIEFAEPDLSFNNSAILEKTGVLDETRKAYELITKNLDATTIIQLFYGDPNRIPGAVLEFPVSGFLLDLVEAPIHEDSQLRLKDKILVAGAMDSRSSIAEDLPFAKKLVLNAVRILEPKEVHVTTNGPLYYTIASKPAREKAREIAALVALLRRESP